MILASLFRLEVFMLRWEKSLEGKRMAGRVAGTLEAGDLGSLEAQYHPHH